MKLQFRFLAMISLLAFLALNSTPSPAQTGAATPTQGEAIQAAQPELEAAYGPVTFKSAEPYYGLDGGVSAWALEFSSAQWQAVAALVTPGAGLQEPTVKIWRGRSCHQNAGMLADAALAVRERLGVHVTLPEKCLWLGPDALWAVYPETNPATGQPVACNLITRQVGTPGATPLLKSAAPTGKLLFPSLFDGEVEYPSDDEITWQCGQSYTVRWSDFDGDDVRIELYKGLVLKESRTTDNDGSTKWTVDKDLPQGSDYRIKISDKYNPFNLDWSDHSFTIASSRRHLIYPSDSGISWKRGNSYTVLWEGFSGDRVTIDLFLGPLRVDSHTTDNDGSTKWTVSDKLVSSSDYKIRIREVNDSSHYDWSDNSFKISGSSAKVTYPSASGITWSRDKKYTVTWSGFSGDDVRIELWKGDTLKGWKNTENDGSTSWSVSKNLSTGSNYKIRISAVKNPLQYDWSDNSFRVK